MLSANSIRRSVFFIAPIDGRKIPPIHANGWGPRNPTGPRPRSPPTGSRAGGAMAGGLSRRTRQGSSPEVINRNSKCFQVIPSGESPWDPLVLSEGDLLLIGGNQRVRLPGKGDPGGYVGPVPAGDAPLVGHAIPGGVRLAPPLFREPAHKARRDDHAGAPSRT